MMKTESSKLQVRRYVAEDMRQALRQIRDDLGPHAVILSSKRTAEGVEVLTTLEYDEEALRQAQLGSSQSAGGTMAGERSSPQAAAGAVDTAFEQLLNQHLETPARGSIDQELMAAMRSEIESLRLLLKDQMAHLAQESWQGRNPVEAAVMKHFADLDISRQVAAPIANAVAQHATIEEGWQTAQRLLGRRIKVADSAQFNQGVVALVGPSGAGKTTTIAKLAVRYALKYNRDELALVTTDRYRLAAYEQLKALGRIIDVPVRLVDEKTDLNKVLRSLRDKSLVLIDTAGLNLADPRKCRQLDELDTATTAIKKLLVLPSTSQSASLRSYCDLLQQHHIDACVLTKTDEVMRFGEVLSLVVEKALPVAYITNGQNIPDDMASARQEQLLGCLMAHSEQAVPEPLAHVVKRPRQSMAAASMGR